ncbi:carbohydrate ABC transporter permease [Devosia sp. SD17-2]|uniref:carbohydrate ABC transporter permease n=1 Tax=Devosia sp. SD17-2 TaxID=2976459 RepID=UPI0023D7BFE1|nr:carbohydrate ABC transporter permease [Devosia sp. SD17-2]WEJ35071.1 carbohydrate ABC transporter permease [Devosia sp. SD17-2]
MNPSHSEKFVSAFWFILTLVFAAIVFFPYYWMFASSVETESMFAWPPHLIPSGFSLESYWTIFEERAIGRWFINTVIVAGSTSVFSTVIAINAAYALSRFKTKTTSIFTILILFSQLLPAALIVVPLFVIFQQLGLYNSLFGLAIADTAFILPVAIWLLKGFFDQIPVEIEQQAMIDGCTQLGAFYRVVLPLALPGLVVVVAMSFISGWDEFFLARTLIASQDNWVLSVGLTSFRGEYTLDWSQMMAAAVIFTVPALIFFLFVQRYLVAGLSAGAVKG